MVSDYYGILDAFRNSDVYQSLYESALSLINEENKIINKDIISLSLIYGKTIIDKLTSLKRNNELRIKLSNINNKIETNRELLSDFGVDIEKLELSLLSLTQGDFQPELPEKLFSQDFLALVMQYLLIMKKSDEGGSE